MLDFYYAPDTIALATHIALHDAGANFTAKRVDFSKEEQKSAEYLAINPKARVPALITDAGILTETPAMLVYVAQCYPHANLAPLGDPFAFAQMQAFNSYICSTLHVNHAHRMRGTRWTDDEAAIKSMQAKVPETVSASFAYLEANEFKGPYVMGEHYSVADPYLFTVSRWADGDGADLTQFPKVAAHREMMKARPSVIAALAEQTGAA